MIRRFVFTLVFLFLLAGGLHVHAQETEDAMTWDTVEGDENTGDQLERDTAIRNINTFLIESYTARIDRILSDLRANIEQYPPAIQIRVLKQVRLSINEKLEELDDTDVSPLRRTILATILEHIIDRVQEDIRRLEEIEE